jgi:hypothetical protein
MIAGKGPLSSPGHNDVRAAIMYTHVLNPGGKGVESPWVTCKEAMRVVWKPRKTLAWDEMRVKPLIKKCLRRDRSRVLSGGKTRKRVYLGTI